MNYATEKSPLANPIKMCELYPQHKDICAELESVICGVIDSSSFINGAEVRQFEEAPARHSDWREAMRFWCRPLDT